MILPRALGAVSVEILKIPPDKPAKWDAADAVAEGLDIPAILKNWEQLVAKDPPPMRKILPLFSIADLQRDSSPMPDDLIAPRILTPGGLLVFGGAPKVGKSDFLIALLAHMAGGASFLGMTSKRPLRVFYLQAEVQYHYLRERIQRLAFTEAATLFLNANFIVTPQISITLNESGIEMVADAVRQRFTDGPPDIIAIDPLRNVFDGGGFGGENDNDAMMFFLAQRLEELRRRLNPDAGIIWLKWIEPSGRRLVWLRAERVRWKLICGRMGVGRTKAWEMYRRALARIASRIPPLERPENKQKQQ